MIGVDTNVLVRLFVPGDDDGQHAAARAFFAGRHAGDPAYISSIVLAEAIWLLRGQFGYGREAVEGLIRMILSSGDFVVEHGDRLSALMAADASSRPQIADHLISWSAEAAGCTHTVTFDRRAAKHLPGMELVA